MDDVPGNGAGGYVTRGRAGELERMIAATEARLGARIDELELELADTRRLARLALAAPIDLAKRTMGAMLEGIKSYTEAGR